MSEGAKSPLSRKQPDNVVPSMSTPHEPIPAQKRRRKSNTIAAKIIDAEKEMSDELMKLSFAKPVTHVYNPLQYAWEAHEWYVRKYGNSKRKILLVGMNPGPWGMAQTGVPFGEVNAVVDFLEMPKTIQIGKPEFENVKRPVQGLSCKRSEVSGRRLWQEWARQEYGEAKLFFQTFYVHNYCPLMFMESGGRNRTPAQLPAAERASISQICNEALCKVVKALDVEVVCGIGAYAETRSSEALQGFDVTVRKILHPSPASPAANRGWAAIAKKQMEDIMESVTCTDTKTKKSRTLS